MIRLFFSLLAASSLAAQIPALKVADDHRHIVTDDGRPFFLLGDTAWELFHRLTREETESYLKNRAEKGFNTILAVALAEYEFSKPNAYGEMPLENDDPTKPRDGYFQHVDWVVSRAASLGLRIAMVPTWGDKWNKKWGKGPEIFTKENAEAFGEWMARRYRDKGVIWILGGDRPVETDPQRQLIRSMAAGIRRGDGGQGLIAFHPSGTRNSSDFWPNEPWLDIHMFQSGHGNRAMPNFDLNAKNLALPALKPTLDGEPNYEDHPVRKLMKGGRPTEWFDDYDCRRAAWWSVLSGACGHVYGTHSIWQFHDPDKRKPVTDARTPWREAMNLPGATQMGVMKRIIESLDWTKLRRSDEFLVSRSGQKPAERQMAAVATDSSFAVVYSPTRDAIRTSFSGAEPLKAGFQATAFDPKTGKQLPVRDAASGVRAFASDVDHDWVLVVSKK